ncbi:MAG TPA: hypothetical protein VL043_14945 [Protaetiibacter sp.]|jgi:hypothetical protein|nr:hypothetical protein [Protaetiibacter sp.]
MRTEAVVSAARMRFALAAVAGVATLTVLTSCEPVGVAPIAVRSVDGELQFLFCERMTSREVLIETRKDGGDWQPIVDTSVILDIADGQVVRLSDIEESMAYEVVALRPGDELAIAVSGINTAQVASYVWTDRLTAGEWLTSDERVAAHPCASAEE